MSEFATGYSEYGDVPAGDEYDVEPVTDDVDGAAEYEPEQVVEPEPEWRPSQADFQWLRGELEALPSYQQYVAAQQAQLGQVTPSGITVGQELNRAQGEVELFLEGVPVNIRGRALQLAEQLASAAEHEYGGDRALGEAALRVGTQQALQESQAVEAFAEAAGYAARAVGADPARLDIADVYRRATAAMPSVAAALPGQSAEEIAVRAIVGAVRSSGGRDVERPLAEDYSLAARILRDLRGPQPQQESSHDYKKGGRAADIASGRIKSNQGMVNR